jgi:SpoVK/Ycf46/Vps4 family AAA+-type ATPase
MEQLLAEPPYNMCTVTESPDVTATLDQYWAGRKAFYGADVQRLATLAKSADAERVWLEYCRGRIGFLNTYLHAGADASENRLRTRMGWTARLAREAHTVFLKDAKAEIWIPSAHNPLQIVRVPGRQGVYDVVTYPHYGGRHLDLGKTLISVRWRQTDLFMVLSPLDYVGLDNFLVIKEEGEYNTEEALPKAFAQALMPFQSNLREAEQAFSGLHKAWNASRQLSIANQQMAGVDHAADLWTRVHIPEAQKLEILRRLDQFKQNDPAAPRGLLLIGPPGTGKTMLARTIAETAGCGYEFLSLSDLKLPNLGGGAQRVREKWEHARAHRPFIMFLDECDSAFGRRGSVHTDQIEEEIVGAFLPEWDGARESSGIWLIGASNRPDLLDDGIVSRFGWTMEIGLPDVANRIEILTQEMRILGSPAFVPAGVGELTQGMSGRDLRNLAASVKSLPGESEATKEQFVEAVRSLRKVRVARVDENATWETLILDEELLDRLKLTATLLRSADKWQAHTSIPRSLLLIGATGSGKERIAQTIANESGLNYLAPSTAEVKGFVLGGSANKVQQLFERGLAMAPVIIFLDRLDIIAPNAASFGPRDPLTDEIIAQVQQEMQNAAVRGSRIFLIGATHNPDQVDQSMLSLFDETMSLPPISRELRARLFSQLLVGKRLGFPLSEGSVQLAQSATVEAVTPGGLVRQVQSAERRALLRATRNGGPGDLQLLLEDFMPVRDRPQ